MRTAALRVAALSSAAFVGCSSYSTSDRDATRVPTPSATATAVVLSTPTPTVAATGTPTPGAPVAFLYVAGGDSGGNPRSETLAAGVDAFGSLLPWLASTPFPSSGTLAAAAWTGMGQVVIAGGYPDFTFAGAVDGVLIGTHSAGNFTAFFPTTPLPTAVAGACAAFALAGGGSYVYVLGGDRTGGSVQSPVSTVHRAAVSGSTLSGWSAVSSLPVPLFASAAFASGGYLFAVGGDTTGSPAPARISTLYAAAILSGGALGSWQSAGALPSPRSAHAIALSGSILYVVGGDPVSAVGRSVVSAAVSAGTVGAFSTQASLPVGFPLRYGALASASGHLFVIGGWDGGNGAFSSVFRAPASGGTVGSWTSVQALPTPTNNHAAFGGG